MRRRRITVVGDALLDRDVVGSVSRMCPDAPAPVLDVEDDRLRPGGAGLAAALLAGDGHDVQLVAPVGSDPSGDSLRQVLAAHGVDLVALPTAASTREKQRFRAGDHSLVRVDRGRSCPPLAVPDAARSALEQAEAVLVSDYAGGVTADADLRALLAESVRRCPVVWDPHPRGEVAVGGAHLLTPNLVEARGLCDDEAEGSDLAVAGRCAQELRRRWDVAAVAVTLGGRGALLERGDGVPLVLPAPTVRHGDPCGAGDRFAAAATAALAAGEIVSSAVESAVRAASAFVAAGGAGGVELADRSRPPAREQTGGDAGLAIERVRAAGGTVVATGGCFDLLHAGHVALLTAARGLGDALVVCVNSDRSVRRLKGPDRPLVSEADRVRVLEALGCVDSVVVFDEDTPADVLRTLRPDIWAKGGDYALRDLPESAVLQEWGGQTVVLPYLDGRSTSTLIGAARGRATATREVS